MNASRQSPLSGHSTPATSATPRLGKHRYANRARRYARLRPYPALRPRRFNRKTPSRAPGCVRALGRIGEQVAQRDGAEVIDEHTICTAPNAVIGALAAARAITRILGARRDPYGALHRFKHLEHRDIRKVARHRDAAARAAHGAGENPAFTRSCWMLRAKE